jgi:hypothetical protein
MAQTSSTANLVYFFTIIDGSGNNITSHWEVITISDNDRPEIVNDLTPFNGSTGDPFIFKFVSSDNILITSGFIEYWFGTGLHANISIPGPGPYTYQLTIPSDSTIPLHFMFHVVDNSGNWEHSSKRTVTISDNDEPELEDDMSPETGKAGEFFTFHAEVSDNMDVLKVQVEYWFGEEEHMFAELDEVGEFTIKLPDSGDTLYYRFVIEDISKKVNTTEVQEVHIEKGPINILIVIIIILLIILIIVVLLMFTGIIIIRRQSKVNDEKSPNSKK